MSFKFTAAATRGRPQLFALAAAMLFTAGASAQAFMQVANISNQTTLNGTLLAQPVTITGSSARLSAAPSVNPPYNAYDIWDNAPTPLPPGVTPAAIYPASARGNPQIVIGSPAGTTAAAPYRVNVRFAQAISDPVLIVYSLDNSVVDLSPTRTRTGEAATASITGNSAAAINSAALTIGANVNNTGLVSAEGCWNTQARACAVVRFSGHYSELNFNTYSTTGGQDGLGFQVGALAVSPPAPVPALGAAGVAALIVAMGLLAARARQHLR